jgi:hypothetical protein
VSWRAAIAGPTGISTDAPAFGLLYAFPTREEAEAHAGCFGAAGVLMELVPCVDHERDEADPVLR